MGWLPGYQVMQIGALAGLLWAGISLPQVGEAVVQNHRQGESARLTAGENQGLSQPSSSSMANPFAEGQLATFMAKFDIPKRHGSGVRVDLGNTKVVQGKEYREVAGKCPVLGKNIVLYQPTRNSHYNNDFLEDIPTEAKANAAGHPLPGGFNNIMKLKDGSPVSPMSISRLESYPALKSKTPLGRCAELSYSIKVPGSEYRYPFVYDTKNGLCYLLYISMQRLMGERYCSKNNNPPGLTWYCFEPQKSVSRRPELAYGSSYVGENPDEWETKCPMKAVAKAVFGVWERGVCVENRHDKDSKVKRVLSREECWALAFNNEESASDHPVSSSENIGTLGYYFPLVGPNQPKSKGEGMNYASFYGGGLMECVLSRKVPTCFVPHEDGVAYNAIGGLEEEPLPECTKNFKDVMSSCDSNRCVRTVTSCSSGEYVSYEDECTPDDGSICESRKPLVIGLAVAGVLLLLLVAGGSIYFFRKRRSKGPVALTADSQSQYMQDEVAAHRKKQRASDLVQQADPSFWGEEADVDAENGDTQVLIDQDY